MRVQNTHHLLFPIGGINVVSARSLQPDLTCVNCLNVRAFDPLEDRARGGSRPGLSVFTPNTNEIQFASNHTGTGGFLKLEFTTPDSNAIATGQFSWAASVAAVQSAIDTAFAGEKIKGTTYVAGDIVVSGGPTAVAPLIFTFGGTAASGHNWGSIVVNDSALTGGSAGTVYTTREGGRAIFSGGSRIQDINYVSYVQPSYSTTNLHFRETRAVVVSNGVVQQCNSTDRVNAQITGNAVLRNDAPFILSTELFSKLYYCDGRNYKVWTAYNGNDAVQSLSADTATGGSFLLKFLLPPGNNGTSVMSGNIGYAATSATIQSSVDTAFAGKTINGVTYTAGDITVSGGPAHTTPVVFTFDGASVNARQWPSIFVDPAKLTGGDPGVISHTTFGRGNVTSDWSLTAGTLPGTPGNGNTNTAARLAETWDGRIVLAALSTDPHNYFMSAKGDPNDFDYSGNTNTGVTELTAVTGGVGVVGKLGDIITALIPYSDDILIFGCDHSIYQMSGNPLGGGRLDNVSTRIGMPFGRPWCRDPEGNVFFFSNLGDVYKMPPYGAKPQKISDAIHPLLKDTNLNTHLVRMEWDDEAEGIQLWISPFTNSVATHWFYSARTNAWFPEKYANSAYNPIAVKLYDGDASGDRVVLMGGEDGQLRFMDPTSGTDDGTAFVRSVTLGPIFRNNEAGAAVFHVITGIQARTDPDSANTKYEILVGDTPQLAQATEANAFVGDGTLSAGFSLRDNPMLGGYFSYVKVGTNNATTAWAMEAIHVTLETVKSDTGRIQFS